MNKPVPLSVMSREIPASMKAQSRCALCVLLAYWTGRDPARINALFRRSGPGTGGSQ